MPERPVNDADLVPFLPRLVPLWLGELEAGGERARNVVGTVLSADISGFTRLAEELSAAGPRLASEQLTDAINQCFEPMIDAALDRGGDILKFGGDALFALFVGAEAPARAAAAAAAMQTVIQNVDVGRGTRLAMTVGVATGPVSLLLAGTSSRRLIVHGPTVDECLMLETDAEPGEVLLCSTTAMALPSDWVSEPEPDVRTLGPGIPPNIDPTWRAHTDPGPPPDVDLSVALSADLAEALSAYTGTGGELRQASIAFILLPTADLDDETVSDVIERVNELTNRYRTSVIGIDVNEQGVKILLSAGAPVASGNDSEALLSVVTELVLAPDAPPMRAGLNRGLVFAGFLGSDRRRVLTVMGDTVNLAARLLGQADLGTIAAAQAVLDQARSHYDTTPLPPVLVRGRVEPVTVFRVGPAMGTVPIERPRPRFVGREEDLGVMLSAVDGARNGSGSAVDLVGEAGIGTTRIVEEVTAGLPPGMLSFDLRGSLASRWRPFSAVRPFLSAVAALAEQASPQESADRLTRWVERTAEEFSALLPLIAPAFGTSIPGNEVSAAIPPEFRQQRANDAIVALLSRAVTVPTMVAVDDFHWVDDASRSLIEAIAKVCPSQPWLLATSTRADGEPLGDPATTIDVGPLTIAACQAIVADSSDLPAARQREIAIRAGGNPLFAVELTATASIAGDLPDSIEAVLTAQIDRLGHEARVWLRSAAALGQEFDTVVLERVLGPGAAAGAAHVGNLIEDRGAGQLRFRSAMVRDVAYGGMSARYRRRLHGRVADAFEELDGDIAVLAWHHDQAGNEEKAWHYYRASADRARDLGLMPDATRHYAAAIDVGDRLTDAGLEPEGLTATLIELFHTGTAAGQQRLGLPAGERALARMTDALGRAKLLVRVAMVEAETNGTYRQQADRLSQEMAAIEDGPEADAIRAWLGSRLAALENRLGHLDIATSIANKAEEAARTSGEAGPLASALLVSHNVLAHRADPRRVPMRDDVIQAAEAAGDQLGLLRAHNNVGLDLQDSGHWVEAKKHYEQAAKHAAERGDTYRQFAPLFNLAVIQADQGRWDEARAALDELRRTAKADDGGSAVALTKRELGRLEVSAGRTEIGRTWLTESHQWFAELGNAAPLQEIELATIAADVAEGRSDAALAAIDRFEADDLPMYLLGRLETMAGYAQLQRANAETALELFQTAVSATEETNRFEHALALIGRAEAEQVLGQNRSAKRSRAEAEAVLRELDVIALPHIPLPK